MKNLHAVLIGAAGAVLTALVSYVGSIDIGSLTSNPLLLGVLGVAIAAASRGLGWLIGKLPR